MAAPLSVILDARRTDLSVEAGRIGRVIAAFAEASAGGLVRDMAILRAPSEPVEEYAALAEAIGARLAPGRPADAAAVLSGEWCLMWRATTPPQPAWEATVIARIEAGRPRPSPALPWFWPRHGALRRRTAMARRSARAPSLAPAAGATPAGSMGPRPELR